jgi:hypothetical protein
MKIDTKANKLALAKDADLDAAMRSAVEDYLNRTGLKLQDFSKRVGYGFSSLRMYMADQYQNVGGTTVHIRKAIGEYIQQHPIAPPTEIVGELYDTANVRKLEHTFQQLLPRPVAYMTYGPPGSQKSFALQYLVAKLNREELAKNGHGRRAFYVYARQGIKPLDLMKRVATACGSRVAGQIDIILNNIRHEFQTRRVLLIIDEAQHLSIECFEILRELLDTPPHFSLLFAGSHDLKHTFDKFSATLEQWNSRIIAKVRLPGLLKDEAEGIVYREVGDVLRGMETQKAIALTAQLIEGATVKDAFNKGDKYINVRRLTSALDQIKLQREQKELAAKGATA